MNTVERIKSICKERKIPISKLEKDLGFGNAYISGLKKGTVPDDRLGKIADYLDLSIEYLMTGEEIGYLYTNENADFLVEVTKMAKDQEFVERMMKYMSLMKENKKSVDDMIDYMYDKENPKEES